MQKFKFELQDVLEYRQFEKQQAQIELGKALAAEKEIQDNLDLLAAQKVAMDKEVSGSTDFLAIVNASKFAGFVRKQSEFLLEKLTEAKLVSDQKREVLKVCMQKVDALEKLKENQLEDWKKQESFEEDDFADDIVTGRFSRK